MNPEIRILLRKSKEHDHHGMWEAWYFVDGPLFPKLGAERDPSVQWTFGATPKEALEALLLLLPIDVSRDNSIKEDTRA